MIPDYYSAREIMAECGRRDWKHFRRSVYHADDIIAAAGARPEEHIAEAPRQNRLRGLDFHLSPFAAYVVLEITNASHGRAAQLYCDLRDESAAVRERFPFCIIEGCYMPAHLWRNDHGRPVHSFTFCTSHRENAIAVLGETFAEGYARSVKAVAA